MKHQIKQRGFTLIELLVVVAIMGTLLGLVAISNRPSRKTQLRMAAQSVASLVVAAQSNALDSEVGSASGFPVMGFMTQTHVRMIVP